MTNKQKKDLATILFFIPRWMNYPEATNEDIKKFFEYSDQGKHKDLVDERKVDGFNSLCQGKVWRDIHVGMYEQGILDGMGYKNIFKDFPDEVIEFMDKSMFKGNGKIKEKLTA